MASVKLMETKDGKRFYKISVSRGYGKSPFTTRFYWPLAADGQPVSKRTAERELKSAAAEFERACAAGEVLTRAEAKEKAAQEAAAAAAEAAKLKKFKDYADGVFMAEKTVMLSENARSSYRSNLDNHIFPVLSDFCMTEITSAQIKKLLVDMQIAGYAHSTVVKVFNILGGIFGMAFEDGTIEINPMARVKRPVPRADEAPKEESEMALTAEELRRVLDCLKQEPLKWQAYIQVMADTGARRGEVCGITWRDINFNKGEITVRHNIQYSKEKGGIYDKRPKNKKVRTVDVGEDTIAILRQLRDEQAAACISKWVFTQDESAEVMFPTSPTKYFKTFGDRYGIANFHPHLLRHTSASLSLTNGADVKSTADRLGHSEAVLLRRYAHSNADSIRKAGTMAREAVSKAQNGEKKAAQG